WVGFLGSRGEDLKGSFTGTVQDLLLDKMMAKPFDVVWFTGDAARSTPAIVIEDEPGAGAAFDALDATVKRGTYTAPDCPVAGEAKSPTATPAEGESATSTATPTPVPKYEISRWVVAD